MGAMINTLIGKATNRTENNGTESNGTRTERGTDRGTTDTDRTPIQRYTSEHKDAIAYFFARCFIVTMAMSYVILAVTQDFYYSPTAYYLIFLTACTLNMSRFYFRYSSSTIPFFSMQFIHFCMLEKSFLSFTYAFLFLKSYPTLPLAVPIILTALLNMGLFTKSIVNLLAPETRPNVKKFSDMVTSQQTQIMRISAMFELLAFPITLLHMTSGHASILQPFVYFTYLKFRVMSGSNPHILLNLQGLEMMFISFTNNRLCPAILASIIRGVIYYIGRICALPTVVGQGAR